MKAFLIVALTFVVHSSFARHTSFLTRFDGGDALLARWPISELQTNGAQAKTITGFIDGDGIEQVLEKPVVIEIASKATLEYHLTPKRVYPERFRRRLVAINETCHHVSSLFACGRRVDPVDNELVPFSHGVCTDCRGISPSSLEAEECVVTRATAIVQCLVPSQLQYQAFSVDPIGALKYDIDVNVDGWALDDDDPQYSRVFVRGGGGSGGGDSGSGDSGSGGRYSFPMPPEPMWEEETLFIPITPWDPRSSITDYWMHIRNDLIDPSGAACGKIGASYEAHVANRGYLGCFDESIANHERWGDADTHFFDYTPDGAPYRGIINRDLKMPYVLTRVIDKPTDVITPDATIEVVVPLTWQPFFKKSGELLPALYLDTSGRQLHFGVRLLDNVARSFVVRLKECTKSSEWSEMKRVELDPETRPEVKDSISTQEDLSGKVCHVMLYDTRTLRAPLAEYIGEVPVETLSTGSRTPPPTRTAANPVEGSPAADVYRSSFFQAMLLSVLAAILVAVCCVELRPVFSCATKNKRQACAVPPLQPRSHPKQLPHRQPHQSQPQARKYVQPQKPQPLPEQTQNLQQKPLPQRSHPLPREYTRPQPLPLRQLHPRPKPQTQPHLQRNQDAVALSVMHGDKADRNLVPVPPRYPFELVTPRRIARASPLSCTETKLRTYYYHTGHQRSVSRSHEVPPLHSAIARFGGDEYQGFKSSWDIV